MHIYQYDKKIYFKILYSLTLVIEIMKKKSEERKYKGSSCLKTETLTSMVAKIPN